MSETTKLWLKQEDLAVLRSALLLARPYGGDEPIDRLLDRVEAAQERLS